MALHHRLKAVLQQPAGLGAPGGRALPKPRPNRKKAWEYYFFVDILGHPDDRQVKRALAELARHTMFVKILGSYPNTAG